MKGDGLETGSRTFSWRLFLGVIPDDYSPANWVTAIRLQRQQFYTKTDENKIVKNKELDPKFFNPLSPDTQNNPWNDLFKDKDVRELIVQDIERTSQEYEFFTQKKVKDILIGILFLWAKENQDIQYKQGLNEVLAIVVFAYFAERMQIYQDLDSLSVDEIASDPDLFVQFVFDSRHTFADIYSTLTCILAYGIKNLYQDTKDISELRRELVRY